MFPGMAEMCVSSQKDCTLKLTHPLIDIDKIRNKSFIEAVLITVNI
jgi:hypothetical protein